MDTPFILNVRKEYKALRPSEQKVADCLIRSDFELAELTIDELAERAEVSQPTVIRFTRAMGLSGFRELKTILLKESAEHRKERDMGEILTFDVNPSDKLVDIPVKVTRANIQQLENTLKNLSALELIRAVEAIAKGRRILLSAAENSCTVAEDLATKLIYLGIDAVFYQDVYRQNLCACSLSPEDTAIGISYTGASESTVDTLRIAKEAGAVTIAVTNHEKAYINRYADIILCSGNEQYFYRNALFSRCAQLAIVDMLYSGLLITDFERFTENLDQRSFVSEKFSLEKKEGKL